MSTPGIRDSRCSKGVSLEVKTTAMIFAVLAVLFVSLHNLIVAQNTVWLAIVTVTAFLLITVVLDIWIYRPLRSLIASSHYRLGRKRARAGPFYRNEQVELGHLVDTLISVSTSAENQETANAGIRDDLVRLRIFNRQLVEVGEIGQEINAALPYRETVDLALSRTKKFMRANFVALLLRNPGARAFTLVSSLGVKLRTIDCSCCLSTPECPVQRAINSKLVTRCSDHVCTLFPRTMRGQIIAPFIVEAVGEMVLIASATSPTTLEVLTDDVMETLQGHLRSALSNAHKYDDIRRQAITDHLTRLYNRRHFMSRAVEELERSLCNQAPISVVMIDIDHFKVFNDSYGHAVGDRVLQAVANTMRSTMRTSDICARQGGEEFVMLLPNTSDDSAVSFAERVRGTLGDTRYAHLGLPDDVNITISAGVATCPRDAITIDELLELADKALYSAKEAGRDRVCQYDVDSDETSSVSQRDRESRPDSGCVERALLLGGG